MAAHPSNNVLNILEHVSSRIHFLHLRNIIKDNKGNFVESDHLHGDVDMSETVKRIVEIMQNRKINLPMRPDHGFLHAKEAKEIYPGYSLLGRLKGLAEISGLEKGITSVFY